MTCHNELARALDTDIQPREGLQLSPNTATPMRGVPRQALPPSLGAIVPDCPPHDECSVFRPITLMNSTTVMDANTTFRPTSRATPVPVGPEHTMESATTADDPMTPLMERGQRTAVVAQTPANSNQRHFSGGVSNSNNGINGTSHRDKLR